MASKFAIPLMSTIDSSQHMRSHTRTHSHQRSSQRLARPFALSRIPSERLDPRSVNYDHNSAAHESGQKRGEHAIMNRASFGANKSISAPTLYTNGKLKGISKRAEATTHEPRTGSTSLSQSYGLPRVDVDGKAEASAMKMNSRSSLHSYQRQVCAGVFLALPYILLSYLSAHQAEPFSTATRVISWGLPTSELLNDLLISLMLTSLTLLFLGAYGRYRRRKSLSGTAKAGLGVVGDTKKVSTIRFDSQTLTRIARRAIGIALPCVATLELGGLSFSVLMLVMISSRLVPLDKDQFDLGHLHGWKRLLVQKTWTLAFSGLLCLGAIQYVSTSWLSSLTGISAVLAFAFLCNPPYLVEAAAENSVMSPLPSAKSTSAVPSTPWDAAEPSSTSPVRKMSSSLIASTEETSLTLITGALTAVTAGVLYPFCTYCVIVPESAGILTLVSLLLVWSLSGIEVSVFGEAPIPLVTGLAAAIIGNAFMLSNFHTGWQDVILGAMAYMAVRLDSAASEALGLAHKHLSPSEKLKRQRTRNISAPTKLLLHSTERYSLLHGILADKDSRRIFYFMLLNLSFMLVQSTYGVLTGSLGLISDSIHMFFDCFALLVGLCAAVMSKWPPSVKYPYGYGKLDTLAGFGNGIFLMLISIEIVWEAVERLVEGSDVSRTMELLVVSSLGLGVNLVGIMAFEHGHGHGHGGHDHSHGGHSHFDAGHAHAQSAHSNSSTSVSKPSQTHHHHGGDNMYGIYLHIMADALGSVAVVISTLCVRYFGWSGFDPLASCAIAILIFASAVPLVFSSGKKLLLSLPGDVEYTLRDILAGVSTIRGVVGYTVPKFWLDDMGKKDLEHELHDHHHHHHHENFHDHHNHDNHAHASEKLHSHQQSHAGDHSHHGACENQDQVILGVIHVIASQHANLDDVRSHVSEYLRSRNMDVVVQVERDGDAKCWCGGGQRSG